MIRRRRHTREIPFSFDSFLDIVANVVGIIIRLILVVWVGARSYSSIQMLARPASPSAVEQRLPADPLQPELAQHQQELANIQERLLAQLRQLRGTEESRASVEQELAGLTVRRHKLEQERTVLDRVAGEYGSAAQRVALTSAEIRTRSQKLAEEIHAIEQLPPLKQTLHYRTPISRPVTSEELLFECNRGRVTFIDIAAMLAEVGQGMEERGKQLREMWQVSDATRAVGAFRLHYTVERERGLLDALGNPLTPPSGGGFRYGLSEWILEPVALERGEPMERALADGSEFRLIVDSIDPQQTAVTFWVYPDSFALFRRLRDYLYERDVTVAGRPLPQGVSIASSRRGTVSRGQ
jgi:hypothetical protein